MASPSSATEESEWKEKVKRWENGIQLATAGVGEVKEYTQTKAYEYVTLGDNDINLWGLYQNDFEGFTIELFNQVGRYKTYVVFYDEEAYGLNKTIREPRLLKPL
jgi:hypothetical protein